MIVGAIVKDLDWDKEVDVLVVGFGAAGGISAITAHDAGAKVLPRSSVLTRGKGCVGARFGLLGQRHPLAFPCFSIARFDVSHCPSDIEDIGAALLRLSHEP